MNQEYLPLIAADSVSAHIIAGMLNDNGIDTRLSPDNMASVFPVAESTIGTVTVSVPSGSVDRARELLLSHDDR